MKFHEIHIAFQEDGGLSLPEIPIVFHEIHIGSHEIHIARTCVKFISLSVKIMSLSVMSYIVSDSLCIRTFITWTELRT